MKRTKEEYLTLLDETINFYSQDTSRRSLDKYGKGAYINSKGNMCAIGRCLKDPRSITPSFISKQVVSKQVINNMKDEYKGFHVNFWRQLFPLHDVPDVWNLEKGSGLTDYGKSHVERVRQMIIRGYFEVPVT